MAFDGITVAALAKELSDDLTGGRVYKIQQTEADELLITIKTAGETSRGRQVRLLLSADASLPLVCLSDEKKQAPDTAPAFCMLLRKHLSNGRIEAITQPGLERVLNFEIRHYDELGDLKTKTLLIELMGKHSNIILTDDNGKVVDAIKHIPASVSSVREVLPGRDYFIPDTMGKHDPLSADLVSFAANLREKPMPVFKALYSAYTGISPVIAQELCFRANLDGDKAAGALTYDEVKALFDTFDSMMAQVRNGEFSPSIAYENGVPKEFAAFPLTSYEETGSLVPCEDMSDLIGRYYAEKNALVRIRQKSADLRRVVQNHLERTVRKYDQQLKQIKDTEKRDKYRVYGELLTVYGYQAAPKDKSITVEDYNTGKEVTIPLDPQLNATENAQKYFARYNKLKRTYETLSELTKEVKGEIDHLESVRYELDIAADEHDLARIREELVLAGIIKKGSAGKDKGKGSKKKKPGERAGEPLHYVSSDGFDIYVGRNNMQNDEITFRLANGGDWWFHAKGVPGSHVILRTGGRDLPDRAFEEAAALAAHYSKSAPEGKVEIDYLQRKDVKKPNGAKPGYVIYYTNYSMVADSDISALTLVAE